MKLNPETHIFHLGYIDIQVYNAVRN